LQARELNEHGLKDLIKDLDLQTELNFWAIFRVII